MVQYISTIPDIEQVELKDYPIGDSFLLDSNIYIKTSGVRNEEVAGYYHTYYTCMCISAGKDAGMLRDIIDDMFIIPINIQISIDSPKVYYSNLNSGKISIDSSKVHTLVNQSVMSDN